MTALNTIPTAAEDSALAPKKDTTTTLRGLVAGVALAAFALGAVAATALRPTATRATTNFETAPLKPLAQKIFDAEINYFNEDPEVLKVPPNPAGYEVYGYNGCGYSLGAGHKQDIDTTFYLADDGNKDTDAVTKSIGKGRCEYFGHTNNPQPTWRTVGKHGVMKPPPLAFQAWPDYLSCGDFADLFKEHCHEHDLPKNACIIDVCFGDAR